MATPGQPAIEPDQSEVETLASALRDEPAVVASLTLRERQVVELLAAGLSNQELATRLDLSVNTIKTYVRHAYIKLEVHSRSQVVAWAFHHGLAPRSPT